jgi:4-amino-4-deoxy-L-arabinose transferase-like glycosyltransferase
VHVSPARERWILLGVVLVGLALQLSMLPRVAYHTDEYRSLHRASLIYDGDYFLDSEPSQKPPLFYFLLAGWFRLFGVSEVAALWLNMAFSLASVLLIHVVARELYGDSLTALISAWLLATARIEVAFAPTIFLDPLMVLLVLAAWSMALKERSVGAGILWGCAFATKQQAVLLLPAVAGSLLVGAARPRRRAVKHLLRFAAGVVAVGSGLLLWGLGSARAPLHFLGGQIENERRAVGGSLLWWPWRDPARELATRLLAWGETTAGLLDGAWLAAIGALGIFVLVAHRALRGSAAGTSWRLRWRADALVGAELLFFLAAHVFVRFRVLVRYALPLTPVLCIALARTLRVGLALTASGSSPARRRVSRVLAAIMLLAPLLSVVVGSVRVPDPRDHGLGARYSGRPTLRPFLLRQANFLSAEDEVYCDVFTHPAAGFFLRPRKVEELTEDRLAEIEGGAAPGKSAPRRFLLWSGELPLEPIRTRLAGRFDLVAIDQWGDGLRLYRMEPVGDRQAQPTAVR